MCKKSLINRESQCFGATTNFFYFFVHLSSCIFMLLKGHSHSMYHSKNALMTIVRNCYYFFYQKSGYSLKRCIRRKFCSDKNFSGNYKQKSYLLHTLRFRETLLFVLWKSIKSCFLSHLFLSLIWIWYVPEPKLDAECFV